MVKSNPDLKLAQNSAMSVTYLGFNTKKAPFDKKEVRQAIAYATNVDDIIGAVFLGAAKKLIPLYHHMFLVITRMQNYILKI